LNWQKIIPRQRKNKMWISEIKLNNFRPFYGEVSIPFSEKSPGKFTIIEAKADTGKTTFLSAISWCLYGKEVEKAHKDYLNPFNIDKKEELEEGDIDSFSVEISLNESKDKNPKYIIRRKAFIRKIDNKAKYDGNENLSMEEWENDNARSIEMEDISKVINSILPEDIHMFFLFEGEKIEKNFSFYSRDSIKNAIEKISQIKQIEFGESHLQTVRDGVFSSKKKSQRDDEYETNIRKIEDFTTRIEEMKENKEKYDKELLTAQSEIEELDKKLSEFNIPLLTELGEKRKRLEEENKEFEIQLKDIRRRLEDNLLENAPQAIGISVIKKFLKEINIEDDEKGIPPRDVANVILQELLDRKKCLCGTDLNPKGGKESLKAINEINKILKREDLGEVAEWLVEGRVKLTGFLERVDDSFIDFRKDEMNHYDKITKKIKINSYEIENTSKRLTGINEEKIKSQEDERKTLSSNLGKQQGSIARIEAGIKMKEADVSKLRRENDSLARNKEGYEEKRKLAEFMDDALKNLKNIKEEILVGVKNKVEKLCYEYFMDLHWDKKSYDNFSISEEYDLSLKDKKGNEKIANISSGTKQVLLLSFISALADVSGFKFPIFIDTPLANTDNEQRENIAKNLPNYLKNNQVILLMKDQEYTPKFRSIIKESVCQEISLTKGDGKAKVKK
jgi:DNA sulfur modification protein DndD